MLYDSGNSNQGSVTTSSGGKGWEVGQRFKKEGTDVYLWLIHVDVWQKSNQYCKAIILQCKTNLMEKEMAMHSRILAWKIPWTKEPGRQQFMELHSQK